MEKAVKDLVEGLVVLMEKVLEVAKEVVVSIIKWLPVVLVVMSVLMVLARLYIFDVYQVDGTSMNPTIQNEDSIVTLAVDEYEVDDIIVMDSIVEEGSHYIKRVVAVAGDEVVIEDGDLYVNGKMVENEDFGETVTYEDEYSNMVVEEGQVYVMGDNREESMDSRYFGTVDLAKVNGKMVMNITEMSK